MHNITKIVKMSFGSLLISLLIGWGIYVFQVESRYQVGPNSRPENGTLNDRPIIGILSQQYFGDFKNYGNNRSYIAASYVKWVESAGGRVIPILMDQPENYYQHLMSGLNGLLFPGGGQFLNDSGYSRTGKILYKLAKEKNDAGSYFPVWGTCLGMELMVILDGLSKIAGPESIMTRCTSMDEVNPLSFVTGKETIKAKSRMYGHASTDLLTTMETSNVTINYHKWCLTPDTFNSNERLKSLFRVLTVNRDVHGLEYISSLEGSSYPFYLVQFHPEKNVFEFVYRTGHRMIPHTSDAISVGQYFGKFFVDEARKSLQRFKSSQEEQDLLIYNFCPEYTIDFENFEQMYFFPLK